MKRNELLFLAFLEGGLVMLLETASPLIVAPIIGHSVIIWALMICLSIGALALGYFLGGHFSKKERDESFVMHLFSINAVIILVGWLLLYVQNTGHSDLGTSFFTWLIVFIVLFIPLILFGATTPVIVSILHNKLGDNQSVVGKLYSVSTLGGVLFSLLTGFWFLPEKGVSDTLLIATFLTSILPLRYFAKQKKQKRMATMVLVAGFSFVLMTIQKELPESNGFKVQYFSESINGQLIVSDFEVDGRPNRILFINRMGQTWINNDTGSSIWPYVNMVTSVASMYPQDSKSLVLGLGGGTVPKQLAELIGHNVDAVELDQRIIDISHEYFGLKDRHATLYTDDARRFVKKTTQKYAFVLMDVFNGEILPSHVLSKEAFEDVKGILRPDGLIAVNFNGFLEGEEGLPGRSLIRTIKEAGFGVKLVDASRGTDTENNRNILYLAYLTEPNWNKAIPLQFGKDSYHFGDHLIDPETLDCSDGLIVTDDKPVMEYINRHAARAWRKTYLENFTLKFKEEYKLPFVK